MGSATASRKARLGEYLERNRPARIGEAEWNALRAALAPVSDSALRALIRRSGLPFDQPWAGVRQSTFAELEDSLLEMGAVYAEARREGRRDRERFIRRQVISAKDHARLAAHNRRTNPARRAEKEEMVEWMLVWLGDPEMFPEWARIRRERLSRPPTARC